MLSTVVVVVEEHRQSRGSLLAVVPEAPVGPLTQAGLDEALGLAIGLGRVRPCVGVLDAERLAGLVEELGALVGQVLETLNQDIVAKDLRLAVEPRPEPAWVMADPVRMQQVLWNVLRNAVKFTPRGGLLQIGTEHKGQEIVVTCRDSGIGIDANSLSRIFVAFEQADLDTYQRFGGLGLGLAIAMGIVTSHGGELEAASDGLDRGATFTLRLPARPTPPFSMTTSKQSDHVRSAGKASDAA